MTTIIKSVPNEKTSITLYYGVATQNVPGELADMVGTIMGEGIKPSSGYIELFATERECVANLTIHGELSETDAAIIPIDFSMEEIEGMEQCIEDDIPFYHPITTYKFKGTIKSERIPKYLDDIKRYAVHHISKEELIRQEVEQMEDLKKKQNAFNTKLYHFNAIKAKKNGGFYKKEHICPQCGNIIVLPATSRKDNQTEICGRCGDMEAYSEQGISTYGILQIERNKLAFMNQWLDEEMDKEGISEADMTAGV